MDEPFVKICGLSNHIMIIFNENLQQFKWTICIYYFENCAKSINNLIHINICDHHRSTMNINNHVI
jgi:hypothetical protein